MHFNLNNYAGGFNSVSTTPLSTIRSTSSPVQVDSHSTLSILKSVAQKVINPSGINTTHQSTTDTKSNYTTFYTYIFIIRPYLIQIILNYLSYVMYNNNKNTKNVDFVFNILKDGNFFLKKFISFYRCVSTVKHNMSNRATLIYVNIYFQSKKKKKNGIYCFILSQSGSL